MAMDYFALSVNSAAMLGILDDLYDIYSTLKSAYEQSMENYFSDPANAHRIPGKMYFDEENYSLKKKLISNFITRNTSIFTDKYPKLYANNNALQGMLMDYAEPTKKPLTLRYRVSSFSFFLKIVQVVVFRILKQRMERELGHSIFDEQIWDPLNERIDRLVKKREISAKIDKPPLEWSKPDSIIVFQSLVGISCNRAGHEIKSSLRVVPLLNGMGSALIPVYRCKSCHRIFIGQKTLETYERLYGKMYIKKVKGDSTNKDFSFLSESLLHEAGYNVQANGMTEAERRQLLRLFIDHGVFTPFEIIRDIEKAIRLFDTRPEFIPAVRKWKSDLKFVAEYKNNDNSGLSQMSRLL